MKGTFLILEPGNKKGAQEASHTRSKNSDPVSFKNLRLFCFPPAGRGASIYAKWNGSLNESVVVCPVQFPGREDRLREKPFTVLPDLLRETVAALVPWLDLPYAFFGHSLGALLAFEIARQLRRRGEKPPVRLLVSARRAPHIPEPHIRISHLPDGPFLEAVRSRYNGIPDVVIQDTELLEIMLPILRADFSVMESYEYRREEPLCCPITVLGGRRDFEVAREDLEAWRIHTTNTCAVQLFPGDHFFLQSAQAEVVRFVNRELSATLAESAGGH